MQTRAPFLRLKPVAEIVEDDREPGLLRSLGTFQLTMIGIGATIGTGIFVALTSAVPSAGPAVILSFVVAGITAALTALCYAELASAIPVSGSSYSYAYATLGEGVAFGVGACLLLEYAVSISAVAVGWGQYLNELLSVVIGWRIPDAYAKPPGHGGWLNLPAVVLVAGCALVLIRGARESAVVNATLVLAKLAVLALFVVVAFTAFDARNLHPFAPRGAAGVGAAASMIFFSYIGLDTVSTASEEARDPRRTLPRAIILSLLIITAIYVLVAVAAVGAQPWGRFAGQEAGLAAILHDVTGRAWPAVVLCVGAIVSIISNALAVMYGQTRILYAMSRDGLLPRLFGRLHPVRRTPNANTAIVAAFVATLAAVFPLDVLINLTSMGTLIAFAVVSAGVIVLRRTRPDLDRPYRVPLFPLLPAASVLSCLYLIGSLPRDTFILFAVWLAGAAAIYFGYSARNSALNAHRT